MLAFEVVTPRVQSKEALLRSIEYISLTQRRQRAPRRQSIGGPGLRPRAIGRHEITPFHSGASVQFAHRDRVQAETMLFESPD